MAGVRSTTTAPIIQFLNRNGQGAFTPNHTPNDAWTAFLNQQLGTSGGLRGQETEFLKSRIANLGGTPVPAGTPADLWAQYLTIKGHTGSTVDKFNQWLDHGTI